MRQPWNLRWAFARRIGPFSCIFSALVLGGWLVRPANADPFQVDIGHADTAASSNHVEPGFGDFSASNTNGQVMGRGPQRISRSFPSPLGVGGTVDVSLEAPLAAPGTLAFRDRGDMQANLADVRADLAEDFVFNEAQLRLVLLRLKPGPFAVTTWHHDPSYAGGTIDIRVGSRTPVGALEQTTGRSTAPADAAFTIEADGATPVVIELISQSRDDAFVAYLNGFSLVPIRVIAAFDVDRSSDPRTQSTTGARGGPFASLRWNDDDPPTSGCTCSSADQGITVTLHGAKGAASVDQGVDGRLSGALRAALLRDSVRLDSGIAAADVQAADDAPSRFRVDLEGLQPGQTYLLTWYAYDEGTEAARPMFIYQDRVAEDRLRFSNVDRFLYTKANKLEREPSLQDAANTFLATADAQGAIHLIAGRGAVVGSDDPADGTTNTVLCGLTVASVAGLPDAWLKRFASRPKVGGPTAVNPMGDSLAKDYSSEVELVPPTAPADAEATFEVEPGFAVELVAAEPMVMDPVGMAFDERGRLFVAEMRGYNQANKAPAAAARQFAFDTEKLGRVKLLEDLDGDGRFDRSTVFVDDLIWPNGIFAYDGGLFVAASPDLLFCKDTDGDGVADIRRVVLTGFGYSNWQHLPNSFRWGLDNRIHGASGSGGGQIRRPTRPEEATVSIRGRDFAFDPRTLALEATNSSAQFGLSFDAWGNKFLTSNSDHILLVYAEDRYIARNPMLIAGRSWRLIAAEGRGADVFRISPPEPHRVIWMRMRATGVIQGIIERGGAPTGYVTAAGGTTIYRGDAWPAEYWGNSFTPECSGNLIHRNVLAPDGVGQIARRVDPKREFLASRDIWFRPVNMLNGPDGNLYMADMYRQVINEAVVLPPALRRCFDLTEGCSHGRIYRVVPKGFRQPRIPDLAKADTAELVGLLEHPNCWHYTTAARLLFERQDPAAIGPLAQRAAASPSPLGRMHALYALDGLGALTPDILLPRLADEHPRVREHAVRLAEKLLGTSPALEKTLTPMWGDEDRRVRYQLAFTLGDMPGSASTAALGAVAARDADDSWVRLALLSSSAGRAGDLFAQVSGDSNRPGGPGVRALLEQLAEQAGMHAEEDQIEKVLTSVDTFAAENRPFARRIVGKLVGGLEKVKSPLAPNLVASNALVGRMLADMRAQAERVASSADAPIARRVDAIESLTLGTLDEAADALVDLLDSRQPQAVAVAAVKGLGRFPGTDAAEAILDSWPGLTPQVRSAAAEVLFARRERLFLLLAAVDDQRIRPSQLDPARIQFLLDHSDPEIRAEAVRLLGDQRPAHRDKVVAAYREALELPAKLERGREVFKRECSKCHRLEGVGYDLGLPLKAVKEKGTEGILLNVLDPNRNINPQYANYVVVTDDGLTVTGMITAETANSITLERAEGERDTVLRANIDELVDTGLSIMPEGLEKQLSKQDVADLVEYLMTAE